jgi:hypothetical protein
MFADIRGAIVIGTIARTFEAVLETKDVYLIEPGALNPRFDAPFVAGKFAYGTGRKIGLPARTRARIDAMEKSGSEISRH